jgi:hypothetical protein
MGSQREIVVEAISKKEYDLLRGDDSRNSKKEVPEGKRKTTPMMSPFEYAGAIHEGCKILNECSEENFPFSIEERERYNYDIIKLSQLGIERGIFDIIIRRQFKGYPPTGEALKRGSPFDYEDWNIKDMIIPKI